MIGKWGDLTVLELVIGSGAVTLLVALLLMVLAAI
jgi:hypothetical protein